MAGRENSKEKEMTGGLFAFTGMAGIFPGSPDVETFWRRILAAEPAPLINLEKRWGIPRSLYFDPEPGKPDLICMDSAFTVDHEGTDDSFRQIELGQSVVRTLYESFGAGNIIPGKERTALVLGTSWSDYSYFSADLRSLYRGENIDPESAQSPGRQLASIASAAGITGPRLSVDTACASSLYAVELAAMLMRSGQADAAVVMGVNAFLPPFLSAIFSQLMALSPEGKSLPFSSEAAGMVPGEAVGALMLEPLAAALEAGRPILGVYRSIGLSSDGAERSVFAPGPEGQMNSYRRAYRDFSSPVVDYIEAHGTATNIGDETEIRTLDAFFRESAGVGKIPLGSIKSLIGHTLAAAGICSIIKALCILRERIIPPHIPVSPHRELGQSCLTLPVKPEPFDTDRMMRIGISSFGFGGSNAHLVLESFDRSHPGEDERLRASRSGKPRTFTVIDMESALGDRLSPGNWLNRDEAPDLREFPRDRFGQAGGPKGMFFPDRATIDAQGLRVGPRLLSRIDPFQNLCSHLTNRLLNRNPAVRNSEETAVILAGNIGGGMPLHFSRKNFLRYRGDSLSPRENTEGPLQPTLMENIASGLGSMFSGYPALHCNLRGHHQTLSGDFRAFWTALLTADDWLGMHCGSLLMGAGTYVKSPVDLAEFAGKGPCAEGIGLFLLKPSDRCGGEKTIGTITMVPGGQAAGLEDACRVAGIEARALERVLTVRFTDEGVESVDGKGFFMAEATGIDLFSRLLAGTQGNAALLIYEGDLLLAALFFHRTGEVSMESASPRLPFEISFHDTLIPRRGALPADGVDPSPVSLSRKEILDWHRSTADGMIRFFEIQKNLALADASPYRKEPQVIRKNTPKPEGNELERRLSGLRKDRGNTVIENPFFNPDTEEYGATLLIKENHPYFFDHPLDHVPGILLLEGVIQLFETALPDLPKPEKGVYFMSSIDITFRNWCEKDSPARLLLKRSGKDVSAFIARIEQNGKAVSRIGIRAGVAAPVPAARREEHTIGPLADRELLHKHRDENVFVESLEKTNGGELYSCGVASPAEGHILNDGDADYYSMLYILEIFRQCAMLVAHTLEGIPIGAPMTLINIRIDMMRPLNRNEQFSIEYVPQKSSKIGDILIADISMTLAGPGGIIGTGTIVSQVSGQDTYRSQRWEKK